MSDILVLIIGGRYGSAASGENLEDKPEFYDRYESITKNEFRAANSKDIPVYILVEKNVASEYEIFKRNRDNETIEYAHVDSVNVFLLLESILNQSRNNPVHQFEFHNEIEVWLKEQWAGLFCELINRRSESKKMASLEDGIEELSVVSCSLQRYMETIVSAVSKSQLDAEQMIDSENQRINREKMVLEFKNTSLCRIATMHGGASNEDVIKAVSEGKSTTEVLEKLESKGTISFHMESWLNQVPNEINIARSVLGLIDLP